jgi:16S rRNA (cytosine967-C5)-methyltransferase
MTPAARLAATIEILDEVARGDAPADAVLTGWFRGHRFAGSGDRRAIRELVYRDLRTGALLRWALAATGGDPASVRARAIAATVFDPGADPAPLFDGSGYGPAALDADELALAARLGALDRDSAPAWARANCPEALYGLLGETLGGDVDAELAALNAQAPLDLRVNILRTTREAARAALAEVGMETEPCPFAETGLRAAERANLDALAPFRDGLVEPQDESSQLVAALVGAGPGETVIDYCAGAGGKALALAAAMQNAGDLVACDVSGARLARIAARAERLGVINVRTVALGAAELPDGLEGLADRVLVDAPCTGGGTWRRSPELRCPTTPETIARYAVEQAMILDAAARLVRPGGRLVFAVCSLFGAEGPGQTARFLADNQAFRRVPHAELLAPDLMGRLGTGDELFLTPYRHRCDGMYASVMERVT